MFGITSKTRNLWKIVYIILIISSLTNCQTSQMPVKKEENFAFRIAGHWYKTTLFPKSDPMILEFDSAGNYKCFDFRNGRQFSEFSIENGILYTDIQRFKIHKMTSDSLVLAHLDAPDRRVCYTSKNPAHLKSAEKNIFMLLPALYAPTVELRVRKIIELFDNEDFITNETVFFLAGVNPYPEPDERNDAPLQREVLANVKSIQKIENEFVVHFRNQENLRLKLPIYENQSRNARQKAVFDLLIKTNTKALIVPQKNGSVRIDIEGIKVGKGFLKMNIPTFTVEGDMGKVLGVKFSLLRR